MGATTPQPQKRSVFFAEVGLLYAAAIWGSTFFIVKWAVGYIDPVTLVAYRFIIATVLTAATLVYLKKPLWRDFKPGFVLGILLALLYVAQTIGLTITRASNSGFITGLFIVFVPLCAWVLYRKLPKKRHIAAVLIAVFGLWLLTGGLDGINLGDWITLASAGTYALHVLYAGEYIKAGHDPWVLNFQQFLVTSVFALICITLFKLPLAVGSISVWWVIAFLAVFPTFSAFVVQLFAQRVVSPTRTALIFTMEPVFAAVFAWTLGGEGVVLLKAVGGGLIVVAMVVSEVEYGWLRRVFTPGQTLDGKGE